MRRLACFALLLLAACAGGKSSGDATTSGSSSEPAEDSPSSSTSEFTSAGTPSLVEFSRIMLAANDYLASGADCTYDAVVKSNKLSIAVAAGIDAVALEIPSSASVARKTSPLGAGSTSDRFSIEGIGAAELVHTEGASDTVVLTDSAGNSVRCTVSN